MLENKNKNVLIESFKKSIESTVKAISNKKNVTIEFGNQKDHKLKKECKYTLLVVLPIQNHKK